MERITQYQAQLANTFKLPDISTTHEQQRRKGSDQTDSGLMNTQNSPKEQKVFNGILQEQERLLDQARQKRSPDNVPTKRNKNDGNSYRGEQSASVTAVSSITSSQQATIAQLQPSTSSSSKSAFTDPISIPSEKISSNSSVARSSQPYAISSSQSSASLSSHQTIPSSLQPTLPSKSTISFNPKPFKLQTESNSMMNSDQAQNNQSFDFTKTPRSFMVQRKFGPGGGTTSAGKIFIEL